MPTPELMGSGTTTASATTSSGANSFLSDIQGFARSLVGAYQSLEPIWNKNAKQPTPIASPPQPVAPKGQVPQAPIGQSAGKKNPPAAVAPQITRSGSYNRAVDDIYGDGAAGGVAPTTMPSTQPAGFFNLPPVNPQWLLFGAIGLVLVLVMLKK